jgi:translation initiation factor IF-3
MLSRAACSRFLARSVRPLSALTRTSLYHVFVKPDPYASQSWSLGISRRDSLLATVFRGQQHLNLFLKRDFSSPRRPHQASPRRPVLSRRPQQQQKKDLGVLTNERLIQAIMRKQRATSPDDVEVRLVIDEGPEKPATVAVVSLSEAIQISIDRMTDLIETEISKDPPVIRATQLSKLEYKKEQTDKKNKTQAKQTKTFRFRSGIGDNDLDRKLADLIKFLKQGLDCDFSVFSKRKMMLQNGNAGLELVERIKNLVGDLAELKKAPATNEAGTRITATFVPTRRN